MKMGRKLSNGMGQFYTLFRGSSNSKMTHWHNESLLSKMTISLIPHGFWSIMNKAHGVILLANIWGCVAFSLCGSIHAYRAEDKQQQLSTISCLKHSRDYVCYWCHQTIQMDKLLDGRNNRIPFCCTLNMIISVDSL